MRIKDLIEQLSTYEENSEVIIYEDDNDREYEIAAIDADEGDESDNDPQIMIIFYRGKMKDLIITYTSENKVIKKEYDHIFDFTDEIEDTNISLPTQRNITATFFENRTEKFNTMDALYRHCVAILK